MEYTSTCVVAIIVHDRVGGDTLTPDETKEERRVTMRAVCAQCVVVRESHHNTRTLLSLDTRRVVRVILLFFLSAVRFCLLPPEGACNETRHGRW